MPCVLEGRAVRGRIRDAPSVARLDDSGAGEAGDVVVDAATTDSQRSAPQPRLRSSLAGGSPAGAAEAGAAGAAAGWRWVCGRAAPPRADGRRRCASMVRGVGNAGVGQARRLLEGLDGGLGAGAEGAVGLALEEAQLDQPLLHQPHALAIECDGLVALADLHPVRRRLDPLRYQQRADQLVDHLEHRCLRVLLADVEGELGQRPRAAARAGCRRCPWTAR